MPRSVHFDEFLDCVRDLIHSPVVLQMQDYIQHANVNCLQHSISVAYVSFLFCKFMGWDARSAARGGLLHDLFLYDWRDEGSHVGLHAFVHPSYSLMNAKSHFYVNPLEEEIILSHMFPLGFALPKHKESMTVCLADKLCAMAELVGLFRRTRLRRVVREVQATYA